MAKKESLSRPTTIESSVDILEVKLKDGIWTTKFDVNSVLPQTFRDYTITLQYDEGPLTRRMKHLRDSLKGTLFESEEISKKDVMLDIKKVEKEIQENKEKCETIKFPAMVMELKYALHNTVINVRTPDNVIEAFNRQKRNLNLYKIILNPAEPNAESK